MGQTLGIARRDRRLAQGRLAQLIALLLALIGAGWAQEAPPRINPGGVVNAASYLPPDVPGGALAQGGIVSIFGERLADEARAAEELPLPLELAGVRVEVLTAAGETLTAPLLYVSGNQVNAILPPPAPVGPNQIRVVRDGAAGGAQAIKTVRRSLGLFAITWDGPGTARPGGIVTLWATGLGAPLDREAKVRALIGEKEAEILFAGQAPCCAGLDQINLRLPSDTPEGCHVPVRAVVGAMASNDLALPLARGGEPCETGQTNRVYLTRTWQDGEAEDSAGALFGNRFAWIDPAGLPPAGTCFAPGPKAVGGVWFDGPPPGPERVEIEGPAGQMILLRENFFLAEASGGIELGPGQYTARSAGGGEPSFAGSLFVPPAPLRGGSNGGFDRLEGWTLRWDGGDPESDVLFWSQPQQGGFDLICRAKAGAGTLTIPPPVLTNLRGGPRTEAFGMSVWAPLEMEQHPDADGLLVYRESFLVESEAPAPLLASSPVTAPNGEEIEAELAVTFEERQQGLMGRQALGAGRGMLFFFENAGLHSFWMYRTLIPLDIVWLDGGRQVVHVERDVPPCPPEMGMGCPAYGPDRAARHVLEIAAGEAARLGIEVGVRLGW